MRCRCGSYTDDGEHVRFRLNPAALVICCMYASRIGIVTSSTLYIVLELIGVPTVTTRRLPLCQLLYEMHAYICMGTTDLDHQQQQPSACI